MARTSLYLLVLAALAPFLYDRYLALSAIAANRPGKFQAVNSFKQHATKFEDELQNCEDVIVDEGMGLAILSCDPGRDRWNTVMGQFYPGPDLKNGGIWLYDYSSPGLSDTEALKPLALVNFDVNDFHPLGMEFEASTSTLYVVNHAQTGSAIEVFHLSVESATATHAVTLKHPLISTPNSIHALGSGKFFFTNDHYIRAAVSPLLSKVETWFGIPGGSIVFFDVNNFTAAKTVARVPFANGIVMLNSSTLAVGSSSKPGVYLYSVTPEFDLVSKSYVRTEAGVDNLSVDGKGTLLMAGHPFAPSLVEVSSNRWKCDIDGGEEERRACECGAPSWAAEWTEAGGVRVLYKGSDICSSSTVVRDTTRGVGIISGLYDRGILVFRE